MKRILYDVPRWDAYLGREARGLPPVEKQDSPELKFGDEIFDRLYTGSDLDAAEAAESGPAQRGPSGENLSAWAQRLHKAAGESPDFARLSKQVAGDADAAGAAADSILAGLRDAMRQNPENPPDANGNDAASRGLRQAIGKAIAQAQQAAADAQDTREAAQGIGQTRKAGKGGGSGGTGWGDASQNGGTLEPMGARDLANKLRSNETLRRILKLAGKFKRIAQRKRRERVRHAPDEIADIETGAELERTLPAELAKLSGGKFRRLAFLRDLTERQVLQYRLDGREAKGRGPIVVCLDKSGSMAGPPDLWATAIALALLDVARTENRPFALLAFDAQIKREDIVPAGGMLPEDALFTYCLGGTSIARVLHRALEICKGEGSAAGATGAAGAGSAADTMRKSDIILITDGQSDWYYAQQFRAEAKEAGVSCYGFGIGVEKEDLAPWCDEATTIKDLSGDLDESTAEALFARV